MNQDVVEIHAAPLELDRVVRAVSAATAGGIDLFLGTTRSERRHDGIDLVALDYEAYAEMAITQMNALIAAARERWPIVRAAILHRVGRVEVTQPSVIIAVACPHRSDAFEACRFLIDDLKKSVTIWKREVWADGSMTWVHPETGVVEHVKQ